MSGKRLRASEDFGWVANALLAIDGILLFLSLVGKIILKLQWAPLVFFSVFRLPGSGLLGAMLNPQALFSPLVIWSFMWAWPVLVQGWCCFFLVWPVMRGWERRTQVMYFLITLIPFFGPAGAHSLMKAQEDLAQD